MASLFACSVQCFLVYFLDTALAFNIQQTFGVSSDVVGYVYIPTMVSFIFVCVFVGKASNYTTKKALIAYSFLIQGLSYFLTGPSETLHIPKYIYQLTQ